LSTPETQFGQVYQSYAGQVARTGQGLSKESRLLLAAMSRANNTGHAIFKAGELRRITAKTLPDGTIKCASRSSVFDALGKLRGAGLLLPGGGETCLWLPQEFWSRKLKGEVMCPVHRTYGGRWATNECA
jgi:hypothetical protein